ncbi:MAG: sulfate adenylyltransferase subunit CysN [Acidobacteriaceae bacterium]|nr:sulfate adenylyltransferase subunit CysN [Acidobacteriaceae bacterium]
MSVATTPAFSIHEFLRQEREKDLLRFSTAGSVDDGKSTLIGRLLYDTQSVYEDQVRSIEGKGTTAPGQLDFALLTDGLRAEREQGITIDVAYRYFSTARRKFIIADTPGHEQYTRNMATGASTADAAVVLIDATKGVLVQSRRHAYIASLLRVRHLLIAVNKMDLVGYNEAAFRGIEHDFAAVLARIAEDTGTPVEATFIPVSALVGDNVVTRSNAMPWYGGPTLLELLESLPASDEARSAPFRFPVQRVVRPDHSFRGFAGQIASGSVRPGDTVRVASSGQIAAVERIVTWDGDLVEAQAPLSVTLVLDRELDISRGELIVSQDDPPPPSKSAKAAVVWMDHRPLDLNRRYLLKQTTRTVPAFVTSIDYRTDISSLMQNPAEMLEMNSIGVANLSLLQPIPIDRYRENRSTGSFILIDPISNSTVAAGMITAASDPARTAAVPLGRVTEDERLARFGHRGGVLELTGPNAVIDQVERYLFEMGAVTVRVGYEALSLGGSIAEAGLIALLVKSTDGNTFEARSGKHHITLSDFDDVPVAVRGLLTRSGILVSGKADNV